MISQALENSIKCMSKLREEEKNFTNAKQQEKWDKDFKTDIENFNEVINKVNNISKKCKFKISQESKIIARTIVEKCKENINLGKVKNYLNFEIHKLIKQLFSQIEEEWNQFYECISRKFLDLLNMTILIARDTEKVKYTIGKIKKGESWEKIDKNINLFVEGIQDVDSILKELEVVDEKIEFLQKVAGGKATIVDLTEDIVEWIARVNIASKLAVRFNA